MGKVEKGKQDRKAVERREVQGGRREGRNWHLELE